MDECVLVEVYIPTVHMHFDIEIVSSLRVSTFLSLLYEVVINRLEDERIVAYFGIVYHAQSHTILVNDESIAANHLRTGDCIYVF